MIQVFGSKKLGKSLKISKNSVTAESSHGKKLLQELSLITTVNYIFLLLITFLLPLYATVSSHGKKLLQELSDPSDASMEACLECIAKDEHAGKLKV